jgi:MtN3 and saliva related transmembrane protein
VSALLTSLSYIPQVRKALPRHSTRDLSLRTLIITVGLGGWILYGLIIADPIIAIANTAGAGLAATVLASKVRDTRIGEN